MTDTFRIGTRGSPLALYQAEMVKTRLEEILPLSRVEIIKIRTSGDMTRRMTPQPLESKRIFTKEIEDALQHGEIDLAVHSAKDLAAVMPEGLCIGAVLPREDARDVLITAGKRPLAELPAGARIGTSSLRRRRQLLYLRPDLAAEEIHGNVGTRLKKMEEGRIDGLILAAAGLKRLGLFSHASEVLDPDSFLPAPGQGIIAIQIRQNDARMAEVMRTAGDRVTAHVLAFERAFLASLEGGCQMPCGIHTRVEDMALDAHAVLLDVDTPARVEARLRISIEDDAVGGSRLAELLRSSGGQAILDKIRRQAGNSSHEKA